MDHINGDHTDNRIENLRWLCPNCHQQTKSWGNGDVIRKPIIHGTFRGYCLKCRCEECRMANSKYQFSVGKRKTDPSIEGIHPKPNAISRNYIPGDPGWRTRPKPHMRKVARPSKEELEFLLRENSWTALGRMFGVSDNAVRKWARLYGML